jgi:hypothetical protein
MIVKEWTIDENGRAKATWVTRERPSSLEYLMKRGIIASDCDTIVPLTRPVEHEIRVSFPVEAQTGSDGSAAGRHPATLPQIESGLGFIRF